MRSLLGSECSVEWLAFLDFHQKTMHFKAGETIIQQGEPVSGIFGMVEGKAKVVINDQDEERLVRLASKGDVLGHRGLGGDWRYPISSIALVDSTVSYISLDVFKILAKTNPTFIYNLMMFFAEELRHSEENRLMLPVPNRVARTLVMNHDSFGLQEGSQLLSFTISRKDIASHASTTYESVIRTLADLAKRKLIRLEGKRIAILDLDCLRAMATATAE